MFKTVYENKQNIVFKLRHEFCKRSVSSIFTILRVRWSLLSLEIVGIAQGK